MSICIFFLLEFFIFYFSTPTIQFQANFVTVQNNEQEEPNAKEDLLEDQLNLEKSSKRQEENLNWYLEIPVIHLKASVREGINQKIMEEFIGHFEETSQWEGNVGLAAHNRGYLNNYFANLKELELGDEIIYFYQGKEKRYQVTKRQIIKDTDWSILEPTQENTITLITCVENEPEYRRCIQGKEKF